MVWFGLPDVGKRSGALKVNLGFWLVAGGLASVRVGGHAVETDLVAPGQEVKAQRLDALMYNSRKEKDGK